MTEYKSQLETLLLCKELLFSGTPGFGRYASLLSHSVAHPAKMNTRLTEFLILELTKPGEVVLDPMSGTGQTGLVAALNSRDAVCVELEEKFHNWQLKAKGKLEVAQTFTAKGSLSCIQGDARKLGKLLMATDAIITSPPYGERHAYLDPEKCRAAVEKLKVNPNSKIGGSLIHETYSNNENNIGNLPLGDIDAIVTSPPYSDSKKGTLDAEAWASRMEKFGSTHESRRERHTPGRLKGAQSMSEGYSVNPDNIGNLPLGEVDAIITSPPYSEGIGHKAGKNASHEHEARLAMQEKYTNQMVSEGNIAVLKHGEVDAVITSPPYVGKEQNGERSKGWGPWDLPKQKDGFKQEFSESKPYEYGEGPDQIGNLKLGKIDAVITSPPYEKTVKDHGASDRANKINIEKNNLSSWAYNAENPDNIGNKAKETYLQAMLTVYSEMFKVLKPGGISAIIVKPFIRNKQVVDLPFQTWLLMQKCGFKLTRLFKLRLDQQSFWRILYMKKYPDVPEIWHEYVLVCEKPTELVCISSEKKEVI